MKTHIESRNERLSEADIKAFEERRNISLPESYVDFIKRWNGGRPEPSLFIDEGRGITVNLGLILPLYGQSADRNHRIQFANADEAGLFPVGASGGGDYFLLDLDTGSIYFWDHEVDSSILRKADLLRLADSLPDLVASLREDPQAPVATPDERADIKEFAESGTSEALGGYLLGRSLEEQNEYGRTLVEEAVLAGNFDLLRACVERGAAARDALHHAVKARNFAIVEYLLELGLDINAIDSRGFTPFDWALGNVATKDWLRERGALPAKFVKSRGSKA